MIISGTTYENGNLISIDVSKIAANNFSENETVKFVQEIHAHWILVEEGYKNRVKYYKCSNCGEPVNVHIPVDKYCSQCGAKMDMKIWKE